MIEGELHSGSQSNLGAVSEVLRPKVTLEVESENAAVQHSKFRQILLVLNIVTSNH